VGEAQSPNGTYMVEEKVKRADHASLFHESRIKEEKYRRRHLEYVCNCKYHCARVVTTNPRRTFILRLMESWLSPGYPLGEQRTAAFARCLYLCVHAVDRTQFLVTVFTVRSLSLARFHISCLSIPFMGVPSYILACRTTFSSLEPSCVTTGI
jgi:hypothetical protein